MIRAPKNFWAKVDRSAGEDGCWPWTGSLTAYGYGNTSVFIDGRWRSAPASAVANFLATGVWERRSEGRCVRHSCDNRSCCNPQHLWGGTFGENAADRAMRSSYRGSRVVLAKLDEGRVAEIRRRIEAGEVMRSVADAYGISPATVQRIYRGYTWRHVSGSDARPLQRVGMAAPSARFTDDQVRAIRRRAAGGEGVRALAREFQTNPSVISRMVTRKAWGHLD